MAQRDYSQMSDEELLSAVNDKYMRGASVRPQPTPIGRPDPRVPASAAASQASAGASRASTQKTYADIQRDREKLAIARQAEARAAAAQQQAAKAAEAATALKRQQSEGKLANLRALENQIARTRQLYNQNIAPEPLGPLSSAMDYLPTPGNKQFDSAGASLGDIGLAAFRVPGVGAQSDAELRAFVEANRPSSRDLDKQIEEKLRNLENRLAETYKAYGVDYTPRRASSNVRNAPRKRNTVKWDELED